MQNILNLVIISDHQKSIVVHISKRALELMLDNLDFSYEYFN